MKEKQNEKHPKKNHRMPDGHGPDRPDRGGILQHYSELPEYPRHSGSDDE